jgi:hypothetical protein
MKRKGSPAIIQMWKIKCDKCSQGSCIRKANRALPLTLPESTRYILTKGKRTQDGKEYEPTITSHTQES